jgi:hypothetical protein
MENILKDEWLKGNIVPREFMFRFNNKRLVMYNINYDRYNDNKIIFGLCVNLVNNLIEKGMITFFDDIPDMVVDVSIHDIGLDGGELCIETFHYKVECEDTVSLHELGCNSPMELSDFFGIENKIYDDRTFYLLK